jgi:hypothetical protein
MQDTSDRVATATILRLDMMVSQTLPLCARPMTQESRSPMYTPSTSRSPSGSETGVRERAFCKSVTVMRLLLFVFQHHLKLLIMGKVKRTPKKQMILLNLPKKV